MSLESMKDGLRQFVMERFEIAADDADFSDDVHLFDYGYVDSFGAAEMLVFVETGLGVVISDEDLVMNALNTINEISTFAFQKSGAAADG